MAFINFDNPRYIALIIPAVILIIFFLKKEWIKFKNKKDEEEWHISKPQRKKLSFFIGIIRSICIIIILIAAASPFISQQVTIEGDEKLTILADKSSSFEIFDTGVADRLKSQLDKYFPTNMNIIASGEKSGIGDGLLSAIKGNDNILLVSDGNVNTGRDLGDVGLYAVAVNSTINVIDLKPQKTDVSVQILGPRKTVADVDNRFSLKISNPSKVQYRVTLDIDGTQEFEKTTDYEEIIFRRKFSEGVHEMTAKITTDDTFSENNIYYKTVEVVDKPNILFITKKSSPIEELLKVLYNPTIANEVPENLGNYHAVILNDLSVLNNKDVDKLSNYVIDGNGLIVIGGENSYNLGDYQNSYLETILPVRVGVPGNEDGDINVFLLIDISGTSGATVGFGTTALDVIKAQAISMINDFKPTDNVGVIAFNVEPYVISQLGPLADKKTDMIDKIRSLQSGGGTFIGPSIERAYNLLKDQPGASNIVVLSDGRTDGINHARTIASKAAADGMHVYTVGTGKKIHATYMQQIAQDGRGIYFEADKSNKLRASFGRPPEDDSGNLTGEYGIVIVDQNHFVTKDINLSASIRGYNQIVPKSAAQLLASTSSGFPVLVSWRFGLGRIVSLGTDDGGKWAGQLLGRENSQLISRSINWAAGDLNRRKQSYVDVQDTHIDEGFEILVKSETKPQVEGLTFSKIDNDLYSSTYIPSRTGYISLLGTKFAVNYNTEFKNMGMNPQLPEIVRATGGSILNPNDVAKLVEQIKINSRRIKSDNVYYRWPLIIIALILFLVELFIRRINEHKIIYGNTKGE